MFSEPSSQNPHPIIKGDTYNVPFSNQIKPRTSKLAVAGHPSVYHAPIIYVCMYFCLSSTRLSSVHHPFILYFPITYPYRSLVYFPTAWLYIDLSCYLCVYLTISPLHLSAPFWLRCFYLFHLCVSVSLAGLSCSLSAPGSSPQTLCLLERQPGRLLLARGP